MTLAYDNVVMLPLPRADGREAHYEGAQVTCELDHGIRSQSGVLVSQPRAFARTIVLCSTILFASLAGPALSGLVYTADDLGAFHLPLRDFYSRALANGDGFDWCGDLFGGFYLTGEGQAGTYHPLHWLVYRLLPLAWAWNIECLASYPVLFVGVWFWLRGRGIAAAESLFGATAFTFCSFNLLHFVHVNAVAVLAHVPWLLYAMDRFNSAITSRPRSPHEKGHRRQPFQSAARASAPFVLIAALTASQLLLGYPQYVLYSLVVEAAYLLFGLPHSGGLAPSKRRVAALWTLGKVLAIAVAAVQVLPTFEAFADSVRHGTDAAFSAQGSLHPLNFVQLLAPYLFATRVVGQNTHELALYLGTVPLLLAMVALGQRAHPIGHCGVRTLRRFAIALVALGGALALGQYSPMHRLLASLPLLGWFRFPCRAAVLMQLGIGLLSAIGFGLLVRAANRKQTVGLPVKVLGLVAFASVVLAAAGPRLWPQFAADAALVWAGPILFAVATIFVVYAGRGNRLALHASVVLTAIDLGAYGLTYAPYRDVCSLDDYIARVSTPSTTYHGRVALDLATPNHGSLHVGNQILLRGLGRIDGYAGLEPARRLDYHQLAALVVAGVDAVTADAPVERSSSSPVAQLRPLPHEWLEVEGALPRARLLGAVYATDDSAHDISHLDTEHVALIDVADRTRVEQHLGHASKAASSVGSTKIIVDRPGYIVVESHALAPAILALTESYHRGWTATAGETPLVAIRVNGDFLGCLLPSGNINVEFSFEPDSLRYGRLISVCGLGFLVIVLAAGAWSRFYCPQGK